MAAIQAQGTTLTYNDGTTAQTVGGVVSFSGFDGEASEIDITNLASTAKEYDIGLEDFGNFSVELIYDPADAGQAAMEAGKSAAATREMVLTLSSGDIATFDVLVKGFSKSGGVDEVVTASVNCRITGSVTWS